jgi:hypothetical protein
MAPSARNPATAPARPEVDEVFTSPGDPAVDGPDGGVGAGVTAVVAPGLAQSCPVRLGPLDWRMKIGRLVMRSPPVTASGVVVSPLAMMTQPLASMALVK